MYTVYLFKRLLPYRPAYVPLYVILERFTYESIISQIFSIFFPVYLCQLLLNPSRFIYIRVLPSQPSCLQPCWKSSLPHCFFFYKHSELIFKSSCHSYLSLLTAQRHAPQQSHSVLPRNQAMLCIFKRLCKHWMEKMTTGCNSNLLSPIGHRNRYLQK